MTLTCPFCNAVLASQNLEQCPRCNELLPKVHGDSLSNKKNLPITEEAKLHTNDAKTISPPKQLEAQPTWFRVGFFLSCLLSAIILGVGLWIINTNKKNQNTQAKVADQAEQADIKSPFGAATIPPVGLPAVRYLPASTQAIAAFQMNPLTDYAKRIKRDPKQILEEIGLPTQFWEVLASTGITVDDLDHFALAAEFESDNAIPSITCVLFFRNAPDQNRAQEIIKRIDNAKLLKLLSLTSRFIEPRILVMSSNPKKIVTQPFEPGGKHFSASLLESLDNRQLSPSSWAWLAADSRNWSETPTMKALAFSPQGKVILERIKLGQALAIGFSLEPEFNVGISVKCDSNQNAESLQEYFGKKGTRYPSLIGKEENWVSIESIVQPSEAVKLFELLLDTKKP
jgi:hypothetical protein